MIEWRRYTLIENSTAKSLTFRIADDFSIPIDQVRKLLDTYSDRVRSMLGIEANPVHWLDDGIQLQNVAGILALAPQLELEVAPKFLGATKGWREDFFFLATLSTNGRLLDQEGLSSSSSARSDLITLIGDCFATLYNENRRRPVRSYRRLRETDFSVDGDFEPEQLSFPDIDGFDQEITSFTRQNPFNAILLSAATQLASSVSDLEIRSRLDHVIHHLPRQPVVARITEKRLPSRARSWQPTFDLARDILRGFGGTFDQKNMVAPGFIMKTWQIWEDLISICLRLGFGAQYVTTKPRYRLGSKYTDAGESAINVVPDCVLEIEENERKQHVVVDAKYKGSYKQNELTISSSDTYEAIAFAKATRVSDVVFVYPMSHMAGSECQGRAGAIDARVVIRVDDIAIRAIELGVRGVSEPGGLIRIAESLKSKIESHLH